MAEGTTEIGNLIAKRFGGLGEKLGSGRQKDVFALGPDKVAVKQKETRPPEFFKAQFYMQKVLHGLFPNNFPDINLASENAVVLQRVPDTKDFAKAKVIQAKYERRKDETGIGFRDPDDQRWITERQEEILRNPEFQQFIDVLEKITSSSPDRSSRELALPTNTVMVDGHPVIVDLFDPVTNGSPTLYSEEIQRIIGNRLETGKLQGADAKSLQDNLARYTENVQKMDHK